MPTQMAVAVLIFGVVFCSFFWGRLRIALKSKRHLKTQGRLRKSWVEKTGQLNSSRQSFSPRVEYVYAVDGKNYVGRELRIPGRSLRTRQEAAKALSPYTTGSPLAVWYDPAAPHICYLEKTHPLEAGLPVMFGGILIVGSLFALVSTK